MTPCFKFAKGQIMSECILWNHRFSKIPPKNLIDFCPENSGYVCYHSIANSSLFPTSLYLHSNSTQILALKKMVFLKKKIFPKKIIFFLPFFYATFQCGRYGVFKKKLKYFFDPEKVKKRASKVAHNRPRPFYFTVQPRPQPTAQNWFFILWNLGTRHLFLSLIHIWRCRRAI